MKNMLGCGQLVGSKRFHRRLKGFERPGGDARGLEIRFGDGEVVWDRGSGMGSQRRRDGRSGKVEERTKEGQNEIKSITPETVVGKGVIMSREITKNNPLVQYATTNGAKMYQANNPKHVKDCPPKEIPQSI